MNSGEKYNVICLSNQLWDFPAWTNKRQVMTRLAKQGHNVLFVDPPINVGNVFLTQIKRGHYNLNRLVTQTKIDVESGALVFGPLNFIPKPVFTAKMHQQRISKLANANFDPNLKTLLWVYHVQIPNIKQYVENLNYDLLIYDCVDNYAAFPEQSSFYRASTNKKTTIEQEECLAKKADVVFASAPGLFNRMKTLNENTHYTPNVGDYAKFSKVAHFKNSPINAQREFPELPDDLKNIPTPRIGFTGALDEYKFDKDLFLKLVKDHPNYQFVVIGPLAIKDKEATKADMGFECLDNVHLLGIKPYKIIEKYYAGFDSFIIPYQLNEYTVDGCFPVKFHDALSAGLPTIVTNMPAYEPFGEVAKIAKSYDEFSQMLKDGVENNSKEKITQRQQVAAKNNWDGKVENMLKIVFQTLNL